MARTTTRIEELGLGVVVTVAIAIYAYAIYHVPDAPRTEVIAESPARSLGFLRILNVITHPVRIVWPHAHIPFIPIAYALSALYNIAYPLVVVLQTIFYIITWPVRLIYALASLMYPLYVFFGVATLVGLAVGSGFAGVAHIIWFAADAKG
ncbi:hypothetical protein CALVIDRAFT_536676 [Calocera viscosa TUFC12733]|uniref:Uncharacterized protein n=1 Tax=Calocera viscosa (strain TUFC12733) TaxID=1330018 RepID=A0A167MZS6_CALVF|nr:hypothetical protein CALVIDRAFT_536676 [Calocera viscosa TUFC12733]